MSRARRRAAVLPRQRHPLKLLYSVQTPAYHGSSNRVIPEMDSGTGRVVIQLLHEFYEKLQLVMHHNFRGCHRSAWARGGDTDYGMALEGQDISLGSPPSPPHPWYGRGSHWS